MFGGLGGGFTPARMIGVSALCQDADLARMKINWQHPLTMGLKACLVPNQVSFVDLVRYRKGNFWQGAGVQLAGKGPASAGGLWFPASAPATSDLDFTSGGWTVGGVASCVTQAVSFGIATHYVNNSGTDCQGIYLGSDTTGATKSAVQVFRNNTAAGHDLLTGTATSAGTGKDITMFATGDGTTVRLYTNGATDGTSTTMNQYPLAITSASLVFGLGVRSGSNGFNGYIAYWWNRTLSATEIAVLHRDPYQILIPEYPLFPIYGPGSYSDTYKTWQAA